MSSRSKKYINAYKSVLAFLCEEAELSSKSLPEIRKNLYKLDNYNTQQVILNSVGIARSSILINTIKNLLSKEPELSQIKFKLGVLYNLHEHGLNLPFSLDDMNYLAGVTLEDPILVVLVEMGIITISKNRNITKIQTIAKERMRVLWPKINSFQEGKVRKKPVLILKKHPTPLIPAIQYILYRDYGHKLMHEDTKLNVKKIDKSILSSVGNDNSGQLLKIRINEHVKDIEDCYKHKLKNIYWFMKTAEERISVKWIKIDPAYLNTDLFPELKNEEGKKLIMLARGRRREEINWMKERDLTFD